MPGENLAIRSGLLKVLDRLLGMDLKLRQYEQGKAFCDGVVARAGIGGLNRVWIGPEALPTVAPASTTSPFLSVPGISARVL